MERLKDKMGSILMNCRYRKPAAKPQTKGSWYFRFLAFCVPIMGFVLVDIALRVMGCLPPEDPLMFYVRTYAQDFSPFVETGDGCLGIKPDWVNQGNVIRGNARQAGRYYCYPGFRPCLIKKEKPANSLRVFVLGGSTTFGLLLEPEAAFPAVLRRRLSEQFQGCEVEVVNLGCAGMASTRISRLLDSVLGLGPDLVIVYSGHNEMLKGDMEIVPTLSVATRIRKAVLSVSTVFGWINHGILSLRSTKEREIVREAMTEIQTGKIPIYEPERAAQNYRWLPTPQLRNAVVARYSTNIRTMLSRAQAANVPILFVLPISNLVYPPGISKHDDRFEKAELFELVFSRALQATKEQHFEAALSDLDRAVQLSPEYAVARYVHGMTLMMLGRQQEALVAFQKACDLDLRVHRITSRLEQAMIEAVESAGLTWVDLRPTYRKEISVDATKRLFIDHCHPTEYGHGLIADEIMPAVVSLLETRHCFTKEKTWLTSNR